MEEILKNSNNLVIVDRLVIDQVDLYNENGKYHEEYCRFPFVFNIEPRI